MRWAFELLGLIAAFVLFELLVPENIDTLSPYVFLLGIAAVVLFGRLARSAKESPLLWSILAAVAYFGPAITLGAQWPIAGILVLGVALTARVMSRPPEGCKPLP